MAWLMAAITTVTPVHTDPAARGGGAWAPGGSRIMDALHGWGQPTDKLTAPQQTLMASVPHH